MVQDEETSKEHSLNSYLWRDNQIGGPYLDYQFCAYRERKELIARSLVEDWLTGGRKNLA